MDHFHLAISFTGALALGIVGIPFYIKAARFKKIVDVPNQRSSHSVPTPRGGGIFIPAGLIATSIFALFIFDTHLENIILLIALSIVAVIGFIDDIKSLPTILRLATHLACGIGVAWATLSSLSTGLSVTAIGLATIWLVGCLNIFNFMDGIDGIATCQGIVAAGVWLVLSQHSGHAISSMLSISIVGGLIAFSFFNWPPAKVFMGDSSSGTLGFVFGAFPLLAANNDWHDIWIHINYGAIALFPFLFDGTYTLFRRLAKRENVLEAHRSHLYQRWVKTGRSHRFVTIAYAIWALYCGLLALAAFFELFPLPIAWALSCIPAVLLLLHSFRFERLETI